MGKTKDTGQLASIVQYDASNNITLPANLTVTGTITGYATTAALGSYVPASRTITINGTALDLSADRTFTIAAGITSFNTRTGAITLTSGDVTTALGFTPYNATNPSGYITGITSANVTTALGFTPYNATNPSSYISLVSAITGYAVGTNAALAATDTILGAFNKIQAQINAKGTGNGTVTSVGGTGTVSGLTLTGTVTTTGNLTLGGTLALTSGNVTTALGFTPYNATNPSGFITSSGSITGNAATASTFSTGRTNYKGVTDNAVAGQLMWKNYANNHTIFDASASTSPDGGAVNNTNAANAWSATYPTLMGWNGSSTYGVRVDSSRVADSAGNATTAGGLAVHAGRNNEANKIVRTDVNGYIQAGWINTTSGAFTTAINKIYCSDDDYMRYQTPANFISNMGLITTSNIGSQSVSYAATAGSAPANGGTSTYATYLNPLSGDGNYKLAYTADGARTNAGEWGRAVMYYVPNGQTYGIRVDRADYANSAGSISGQANSATINATSGNAGNQIVLRDGNGDIAIGTLNASHAYFGSGGRGITAADTYGSYGNIMTYGTGQNGYSGYGIYTAAGYRTFFMGEGGNFGIYGQTIGKWAFYYSNSTASYSIGSADAVSGYTLYLIYGLYTVGLYNASDARMKKDIKSLSSSLNKVKQLRGVSYEYIDKGPDGSKNRGTELGFIAQEVLPVIPELVRYDNDKGYAMNYQGMSAVLVEAIKEQQIQIENQQIQIENQQNQINNLTLQLTELLNK